MRCRIVADSVADSCRFVADVPLFRRCFSRCYGAVIGAVPNRVKIKKSQELQSDDKDGWGI
jgi:hypothetical protein